MNIWVATVVQPDRFCEGMEQFKLDLIAESTGKKPFYLTGPPLLLQSPDLALIWPAFGP